MAVTALSRSSPGHSLKFLVWVFGSWAVDRIVTAMVMTGLLAAGGQGTGQHPGLGLEQVSWAAGRVQ